MNKNTFHVGPNYFLDIQCHLNCRMWTKRNEKYLADEYNKQYDQENSNSFDKFCHAF